jgi:hypothetical protein
MPIVTCPGCSRRIDLPFEELTLGIQCVQCRAQFMPLTGERIDQQNDEEKIRTPGFGEPPVRVHREHDSFAPYPPSAPMSTDSQGLVTACFLCGIAAVLLLFIPMFGPLAVPLGGVAVAMAIISFARTGRFAGLAGVGAVLGGLSLVLCMAVIIENQRVAAREQKIQFLLDLFRWSFGRW